MEELKNLKRVVLNELRKLDSQMANKEEFSDSEARKYDCLTHALKCHLTAEAMLEAEELGEEGVSERRGRGVDGRYVSRLGADSSAKTSYSDGYSRGYSEAMAQMNHDNYSGHYPVAPYYDRPVRW